MRPDPERRPDGRCARPGCSKRLAESTARHRRYGGDAILSDPFCSTECCKAFHQTGSVFPAGAGVFSKANL